MRQEFSLVSSIVCIYKTFTGIYCDVTQKHCLDLLSLVSFHAMTEADYEQLHHEIFDDNNFCWILCRQTNAVFLSLLQTKEC